MKKILLWILILLITLAGASAWYEPLHYWPLDGNFADNVTANKSDMRITKGTPSSQNNCVQAGCYFFQAAAVSNMSVAVKNPSQIRTIELWHRINETAGEDTIIDLSDGSTSISNELWCKRSTIQYQCRIDRGGAFVADQAANHNGVGWRHLVIQMIDSRVVLFEDGTILLNFSAGTDGFDGNFTNWTIGHSWAFNQVSNKGLIDNVAFFKETYTQTNITAAYNGGSGQNYSGGGGGAPAAVSKNFNVSNIINLTPINTFNITITNSSYSEQFNLTNGSININVTNGIYNISIQSLEHFDLFAQDFNLTPADDYNFRVGQGLLSINLTKLITQTQMTNITANNSIVSNFSGSSDQVTLFVNTGLNQINVSGFNFTARNINYTLASPVTNVSARFNVTDTLFRFNATDSFNGSGVYNFGLNVTNTTYSFSIYGNVTGQGTILMDLENVSFDARLFANGYAEENVSFSALTNQSNHTFLMRKANTLNLSVLNELDRQFILNGTVFVELIGETYSINTTNNTFANTTLLFEGVPAGDYEIRYRSDGFPQRSKYVVITSSGSAQTDLYLLDEENSTDITFTITDQFLNKLENSTVKALRFYNLGGGTSTGFIEVAHCRTNFVGQCSINLQSPEVFYKFLIEYDGRTLFTSTPTEIIGTTFNFQVNTEESVLTSVKKLNDEIWGNITFVNSTTPNYFLATFNAPTGQLNYACLRVTKVNLASTVLVNETCLSASAGSITVDINESDISTYTATLFVDTASKNSFLNLATLAVNLAVGFKTFGLQGLFYSFMLLGVVISVGVFSPSAAIIITIVGLILLQFTGMSAVMFGGTVILAVSGLILVGYIKS